MAKAPYVFNESRKCLMRLKQAEKGIEACALAWVIPGESVRQLNYAEAIAARNEQAKRKEGLTYFVEGIDKDGRRILIEKPYLAEIHGLTFDHEGARTESQLAAQANRYAEEQAA